MTSVLDGLTVVDLSSGPAGAMASMLMSDNGANVIRIEPPGGDWLRAYPCSTVWGRGKRSVVLDLRTSFGVEQVLRLAATADVVLETFAPGVAESLGIAERTMRAANDRLVYCSISGYGRDTRRSARPAVDALVAAHMGLHWDQRGFEGTIADHIQRRVPEESAIAVPAGAEQTGHREGPIFQPLPWPSIGAALLANVGVSAALLAREMTGGGQRVDTSLLQGALLSTVPTWQRIADPHLPGYRLPYFDRRHPKGLFRTADGQWLHQWAPIHHQFAQKVAGTGSPASEPVPRPTTGGGSYEDMLRAELEQHPFTSLAFATLPRDEWISCFAEAGLPAQPVRPPEEALLDPYSLAEGCVARVDDPEQGATRQVGIVYRMSATPGRVQGPTARLGAHTEGVLAALSQPQAPAGAGSAAPTRPRLHHPLEGVVVLDLGLAMAGPYGAQTLADLGATVIKVNNVTEAAAPVSSPSIGCNRGKRSIAVNLKDPRGRRVFEALATNADVIHHNMRTGVAERLGVDYETVKAFNPEIIYCHTRGFESSGPRAGLPGNDQMGQALAGSEYEMGACHHGQPPVWHPAALGDFGNGVLSAVAVIQALYHRARTGRGQMVDTSILNVSLLFNSYTYVREDGSAPERPRLDAEQLGLTALYGLYATSDGWLCLAAHPPKAWESLVDAIDEPALRQARFSSVAGRARHDGALRAELTRAFRRRPASEWFELLDGAAVPCEICDDTFPQTMFDDTDLVQRQWVVSYPHPRLGRLDQAGHLVELSETPGKIWGPAPLVGQHTREILAGAGYGSADIEVLLGEGVVSEP